MCIKDMTYDKYYINKSVLSTVNLLLTYIGFITTICVIVNSQVEITCNKDDIQQLQYICKFSATFVILSIMQFLFLPLIPVPSMLENNNCRNFPATLDTQLPTPCMTSFLSYINLIDITNLALNKWLYLFNKLCYASYDQLHT